MTQKYSLFQTEVFLGGYTWNLGRDDEQTTEDIIERVFRYIGTYDTLEEAYIAQKEIKQKTLILPSY